MNKVPLLIVLAAVASASAGSATPARSTVTVRVDDSRITSPSRWPSGYVDVHIVTAGNVHHHLAFWHLNPGVTVKRFRAALNSAQGPFRIATAVGGNGPMLAGHVDVTMHLVPGTVMFADIVDGPATRIASFEVSGPPVSTDPPAAVGTIDTGGSASFSRRILVGRVSTASGTAIRLRTTGRSSGSARARPRPALSAGSAVVGRGVRLSSSRGRWADPA